MLARGLLCASAIVLFSAQAWADPPPPTSPAPRPPPALPSPLAPLAASPLPVAPLPPAPPPLQQALQPPGHTSDAMMISGIVLTGLGSAMLISGALTMAASVRNAPGVAIGAIVMAVSPAPAVIGVPLWAGGAVSPDRRYRSNGRRVAGITLTAMGAFIALAGVGAGAALAVAEQPRCQTSELGCGLGWLVVTAPISVSGAIMGAVGAPLWVSGAHSPDQGPAAIPPWAVPHVSVGPGSGSLRWTF